MRIFSNAPTATPSTSAEIVYVLVPLGSGKKFKIGSWPGEEGKCQ